MANGEDPLVGFNFRLEIEGKADGYFTEVSGLGSEHEVIEHKVVDDSGHELVKQIPGRLKWSPITLKRGITANLDMWEWRQEVEQGDLSSARTNCSIVMMDRNYQEIARWDIVNAWPTKISGPTLSSSSNEVGIEELTIVHEGMVRSQ
ncbi:MAG: phage tail protein [Chloroflexi bacterium]|nr:MAG: phage tail protein [Chloroflexota bacterium]RLC96317.1 MAG: phage tail protein [Chloroflexota bacterium]